MNKDKLLLRAWHKTRRLKMEPSSVTKLSEIIQQKLLDQVAWQNIKTIHCYEAIESLNEVKTDKIIDFIQGHPNIHLETAPMNSAPIIAQQKFDLIIVPTLAYDARGYRLGWGGGYYDMFLATQPQAMKIGLCFYLGFTKAGLPHEPHDIALDKIITEV